MDKFKYKNGNLYCEDVKISDITDKLGTPVYVYSQATLEDHFNGIKDAFEEINPLICYSIKNNSNLNILKILKNLGAGMDVVTGGELARALDIGTDPSKIVFAGVSKTEDDILTGLENKIGWFNVESAEELANVARIATMHKTKATAAIRINPNVYDPKTHIKTATGIQDTKFGIDMLQAKSLYLQYANHPYIEVTGLHIHIGSPIYSAEPYVQAIDKILAYIEELRQEGVIIKSFDIGGGFLAKYVGTEGLNSWEQYSKPIVATLKPFVASGGQVIMEPGRSIAGNSGILVSKVLYNKVGVSKKFIILDSGMNHLIRPAFYDAFHFIWPVKVDSKYSLAKNRLVPKELEEQLDVFDVVGPICESSDFFAKDRPLPPLSQNDLVAIFTAGSYAMSMASQYNSLVRPPEVLVYKNKAEVIRKREVFEDLVALERSPQKLL